jgi:hypothetical protein
MTPGDLRYLTIHADKQLPPLMDIDKNPKKEVDQRTMATTRCRTCVLCSLFRRVTSLGSLHILINFFLAWHWLLPRHFCVPFGLQFGLHPPSGARLQEPILSSFE